MFRWYAINTYSGHENKVKTNLEHRIDSMAQQQQMTIAMAVDRSLRPVLQASSAASTDPHQPASINQNQQEG